MALTDQQKRAVRAARKALGTARAGILPEGIDPEQAQAFWRGYLDRALATLLDELEGDQS